MQFFLNLSSAAARCRRANEDYEVAPGTQPALLGKNHLAHLPLRTVPRHRSPQPAVRP